MKGRWIFCVCTEEMCWCDNMVFVAEGDPREQAIIDATDYIAACTTCASGSHRFYPPGPADFMKVVDRVARG